MTRTHNPTESLIGELKKCKTRGEMAVFYAKGIRIQHLIDWRVINKFILKRYTPSGLDHIKMLAWRVVYQFQFRSGRSEGQRFESQALCDSVRAYLLFYSGYCGLWVGSGSGSP